MEVFLHDVLQGAVFHNSRPGVPQTFGSQQALVSRRLGSAPSSFFSTDLGFRDVFSTRLGSERTCTSKRFPADFGSNRTGVCGKTCGNICATLVVFAEKLAESFVETHVALSEKTCGSICGNTYVVFAENLVETFVEIYVVFAGKFAENGVENRAVSC